LGVAGRTQGALDWLPASRFGAKSAGRNMSRRFRPRVYARAHLGCLGCSVPLILLPVVVALLWVGLA